MHAVLPGVYLGRPYVFDVDGVHSVRYNTGGPGYVLDSVAVKVSGGDVMIER